MSDQCFVGIRQLHFGNAQAFHDIYHGSRRWDKDPGLYQTAGLKTGSFGFLKYHQARERREVLLPIFSKKAIQSLEHLVWKNVGKASIARVLIPNL
jgi:hypothetical protein